MRTRLAKTDDLSSLMTMVRRVVPLMRAQGNLQWDDNYPNESVFLSDIERSRLWVAEIEGNVAGVVALTTDPEPDYIHADWDVAQPALVIHRLAVDPAFRGAGVARALMLKAEAIAISLGISVIRTDTNTENTATQRLFPSLGYRSAGEISLQSRPGQRFLCYEKQLALQSGSDLSH
ncbi:MAG TPA: GNAT family N-acetyltransferase [Edaphobacter sp.]|nr:GNAT family N-acetyltransferase [Edaphobacter sp.]